MIRWTTALILIGALVAAVLFDRIDPDPNSDPGVLVIERPTPSMDAVAPLGSSWFCAVGSSGAESYADAEITVTNVGDVAAVANLDIRTPDGPGPGLRVDIAPGTSATVPIATLGTFEAAVSRSRSSAARVLSAIRSRHLRGSLRGRVLLARRPRGSSPAARPPATPVTSLPCSIRSRTMWSSPPPSKRRPALASRTSSSHERFLHNPFL